MQVKQETNWQTNSPKKAAAARSARTAIDGRPHTNWHSRRKTRKHAENVAAFFGMLASALLTKEAVREITKCRAPRKYAVNVANSSRTASNGTHTRANALEMHWTIANVNSAESCFYSCKSVSNMKAAARNALAVGYGIPSSGDAHAAGNSKKALPRPKSSKIKRRGTKTTAVEPRKQILRAANAPNNGTASRRASPTKTSVGAATRRNELVNAAIGCSTPSQHAANTNKRNAVRRRHRHRYPKRTRSFPPFFGASVLWRKHKRPLAQSGLRPLAQQWPSVVRFRPFVAVCLVLPSRFCFGDLPRCCPCLVFALFCLSTHPTPAHSQVLTHHQKVDHIPHTFDRCWRPLAPAQRPLALHQMARVLWRSGARRTPSLVSFFRHIIAYRTTTGFVFFPHRENHTHSFLDHNRNIVFHVDIMPRPLNPDNNRMTCRPFLLGSLEIGTTTHTAHCVFREPGSVEDMPTQQELLRLARTAISRSTGRLYATRF